LVKYDTPNLVRTVSIGTLWLSLLLQGDGAAAAVAVVAGWSGECGGGDAGDGRRGTRNYRPGVNVIKIPC
jgi:hypothetical protein